MSDKPTMEEMAAVLARLEKEWQELAALLQSHGQARDLEAEKILLRDAAGAPRGKISVEEDGSTVLHLSDADCQAWARLGINPEGQAFLELKDRERETGFKLRASPSPNISPAPPPHIKSARVSLAELEKLQQPPETAATPPAEPAEPEPSQAPPRDETPPEEVPPAVAARLAQLEQRHRRQWLFQIPILVIVLLILAAQAYWLLKPGPQGRLEVSSLVVRDAQGHIRASLGRKDGKLGLRLWDDHGKRRASLELGPQGSPALVFYDRQEQPRAELQLGPAGNPTFNLRDILSLPGQIPPQALNDPSRPAAATAPPAAPVASAAPPKAAAPEVVYVGSITSNKYHYPTCKWAKTILPYKVIKFHSVEEARQRHYIPCPVCKPPPLGP